MPAIPARCGLNPIPCNGLRTPVCTGASNQVSILLRSKSSAFSTMNCRRGGTSPPMSNRKPAAFAHPPCGCAEACASADP